MIQRIILLTILLFSSLYSKESLYLHIPSSLPSKNSNTSFGNELIQLINNTKKEISFAIYGLRGQDDILKALIDA